MFLFRTGSGSVHSDGVGVLAPRKHVCMRNCCSINRNGEWNEED